MDAAIWVLRFAGALGCGLMAGLFFAFSVAVMPGIARIAPEHGMAAMQAINRAILNPVFAVVFFGTAVVCLIVLAASVWRWSEPGSAYALTGSLLYLGGCILVTVIFNVPLNNALEGASAESIDGTALWSTYLTTWTAWNHLRTMACLAALAAFIGALRAGNG
jgi:uncharacterized membrane protein